MRCITYRKTENLNQTAAENWNPISVDNAYECLKRIFDSNSKKNCCDVSVLTIEINRELNWEQGERFAHRCVSVFSLSSSSLLSSSLSRGTSSEGREQTSFQLSHDKHKPPHYGHDSQLVVTLDWSRDDVGDSAYRMLLATALEIPRRNLRITFEWFHGDTLWRLEMYGTASLLCVTGGVRETCGPQIHVSASA
jgi:hypothetical protein